MSAAETTLVDEFRARLRLKWLVLRTAIDERLAYRADFAFSTFVRFLPIVTQIFLWVAIFQNDPERQMQGYRFADMVAYYLLAMLARAFSSMPGLSTGIAGSIADGSIRKYLIQPVDMLDHLFWHRIAHKLVALSGLVPRLAGVASDCGFRGIAADGICDWFSDRSMDRARGILVSGSQFADFHLHDAQLLSFRPHDSAGMVVRLDSGS
jgi:hypothetical protein